MARKDILPIGMIVWLFTMSCHSSRERAPDVSHISMSVHIDRFDQEFMQSDSNRISESLSELHQKYPVFLPVYLENILNFGAYSDTGAILRREVRAFITAKDIRLLQDTVNAHFPDTREVEAALRQGFRYIKYYFPSFQPPRVITFISGLANYGAVTADSVLGIGLDMFLGKNFVPYTKVADPYPEYMLYQFSPEFIAPDCFKVLQQQMFPMKPDGTLLDMMIRYGKQLYFLDKVMPGAPDSVKIGFTSAQLRWCRENEQYIWQYFVQNSLLYIHDMQRIMHYIGPGPSTQGMPSPSPGNIGSWLGWQIVRKYMDENPETTLEQLMKMENAQLLLSAAHYRPH
jgi:gliding motility-associated lipoprotein GldB